MGYSLTCFEYALLHQTISYHFPAGLSLSMGNISLNFGVPSPEPYSTTQNSPFTILTRDLHQPHGSLAAVDDKA